ncbi:uncharacterized protein A4U43_C03F12430 [Asparagus officinalis]|uniref:Uncharacterized protein n=1 Tax=Asparagus officinalis TaxID=4686 RepID=A0A5P1F9F0_ASPOF|nr:uncharacterized protein A4U43_C03F12430 [Asparagus officinalis]
MKQTQTRTLALDSGDAHNPTRNQNPRPRRIRSPALGRVRLRRNAAGSGGGKRSGGPTTPLLKWKFDDADSESGSAPESEKGRQKGKREEMRPDVVDPHSSSLRANPKHDRRQPILLNYPKNGVLHKFGASGALPDSSMERATKWDPGFYSHLKNLEDQQVITVPNVSSLQSELEHARARIAELETEQQSAKKKLDHLVRKLGEEKESWRRREHEKIRAVIESIKDDLHRERKNRKRMEIVNSKLVNELAEAKLSAKMFLQDYEKEKKTRELMEEVCDELAKEIGEDKAEVEALKADSMRIREEVEEERKMLQMAEVWREERVQMKLVDAKVTLEAKYSELSKLQAEIEAFLRARRNSIPNDQETEEAELLREAANLLKVQEVKEFPYQPPPASEDIFSVFEELQPKEEPNEREIEACQGYTNGNINGCSNKPPKGFANGMLDTNGGDIDVDDDSGWETVSHVEEQGSSNSIEGSDPSVNGACEESNASVSGTDWDENGDNGKVNSDISEVCSVGTKQSRKKGSSIASAVGGEKSVALVDALVLKFLLLSARIHTCCKFT